MVAQMSPPAADASAEELVARLVAAVDAGAFGDVVADVVAPVGLIRPATVAPLALAAWLAQATTDRAALADYLAVLDAERASVAADIAALEVAMGRVDPVAAQAAGVAVSRRMLQASAPAGPSEGTRANRPPLAATLAALERAAYNRTAPALATLLAACDAVLSAAGERSPADYALPAGGDRAARRDAETAAARRWVAAGQDADTLTALAATLGGRVQAGARRQCTAADIVELMRDGGETVTDAARRVATALA